MDNYQLTHTIIQIAVENGIQYIRDNPKRGVRNLLDLGEYFATGRFQKYFFNLAHEILYNENSLYYDIIESLVKNTDHKILTSYGINMGFNSFTYGAGIIREKEKKYGYNIPWTIIFNFAEKTKNHLTGAEVSNIISSGKDIGIYSYMFILSNNNLLNNLYDVFKKNNDCAFTLFIDTKLIDEATAKNISSMQNICILMSVDDLKSSNNITAEKFNMLKKYKCLYGGYYFYDDNNAENISDGTVSHILQSLNLNFAVCIRKSGCSDIIAKGIYDYIYNTRVKINAPVFLIDLYGDCTRIDKIISVESCFLSINSYGQICVSDIFNKTQYNIRNKSLEYILSNTMPKVKYI